MKENRIIIKNGHIIDPANNINQVADILVEGSKITKVARGIKEKAARIIDATNKIVMPGLVDMHVHLREPGREDKETVATGTRAALKGGVTTLLAMPNTIPAIDSAEHVKALKKIIKETAQANVLIAGAITRERLGKEVANFALLKKNGVVAITDDGSSVDSEQIFTRALKEAKHEGLLVICHSEDKALSNKGLVNLGFTSTRLGLRGISKESEYSRVERDIQLAAKTKAAMHIAHLSCAESVEIVAKAKKRGLRITAETCPHYFALNEESVLDYDANMKMNPPLRGAEDAKAIKEGIRSGIIDAIASDHAPHTENEKNVEFEFAEFGVIGLETMLSVAITELIMTKILNWDELVKRLSLSPARILGVDKGTLGVGQDADIIVLAPNIEWVVSKEHLISKSKNSAFLNRKLKGLVTQTILSGKLVMDIEYSSHF